jgi:hypothetical protein
MKAALRDSYIEFVLFMGMTEKYPLWFEKEMEYTVFQDESRYTFWVPMGERRPDYHEKTLVEDYSVFLRKPNGEVFVTDYDVFRGMYTTFQYNAFTNSGIAAFDDDCIEYVECKAGVLPAGYPNWFYEYFTEAINFPPDGETIYFYDSDRHRLTASRDSIIVSVDGEASVTSHCVFLRNKFGEIRGMRYDDFIKYYDPRPQLGGLI